MKQTTLTGNPSPRTSTQHVSHEAGKEDQSDPPSFVNQLSEWFQFISMETVKEEDKKTGQKRDRNKVTMQCALCRDLDNGSNSSSKKAKGKTISSYGKAAFTRHLKRSHPESYVKSVQNQTETSSDTEDFSQQSDLISAVIGSITPQSSDVQPEPYGIQSTKQKLFDKSLLDFIVIDGHPLSLSEGDGFKMLIKILDCRYIIPSRKKICRMLNDQYENLLDHIKVKIKKAQSGTLHLLLDMWSTKQQMSVIGLKARFIEDWNVKQIVLGFQHFPGSPDAVSIRNKLRNLISEKFGIPMHYFATFTADNASAIIAAFRDTPNGLQDHTNTTILGVESSNSVSSSTKASSTVRTGVTENPNSEDTEPEEDIMVDLVVDKSMEANFQAVINEWACSKSMAFPLQRNSCLAHLLQLAIKDALKHKLTSDIMKKVTNIVSWFNKSNIHYTKLKDLSSNGTGLVKPCETRWNSFYFCLLRLCQQVPLRRQESAENVEDSNSKQDNVFNLVNEVLKEAKRAKKNDKSPQILSREEIATIRVLCDLLCPFAELSDEWQADGVTSSLVIVGLIDAISSLNNVAVDETLENYETLLDFREELRFSVIARFGTNKVLGQKVKDRNGADRNVMAVDVFNDPNYILATVLDPRLKLSPFEDRSLNPGFQNGFPTSASVTELLREKLKISVTATCTDEPVEILSSTLGSTQNDSTKNCSRNAAEDSSFEKPAPPKKKQRMLFSCIRSKESMPKPLCEVDLYLQLNMSDLAENPLSFWRKNEDRLIGLSKLAKRYLAMPATSASVERLFSIAGSIMRSRRASLKIKTAEKLLCYKEFRISGVK